MPMLRDGEALKALAAVADQPEASRSAYWEYQVGNFAVAADGTFTGQSTLGNASPSTSAVRNAAHYVLQRPLCWLASSFRDLADCERLGRLIARRQDRQFNYDMLRQVLSLALIRHYLRLDSAGDCNLVIGDGYGTMTALLLMDASHRRTIAVNLTKPLLLDLAYASRALPDTRIALVGDRHDMRAALADDDVRLIGVRADNVSVLDQAPIGLAVNVVSMQEMEPAVVARYFQVLRNNRAGKTAFYCCNRLHKVSHFEDYPWHPEDRVLHDSVCPWSQWYYSAMPPFWHRRRAGKKLVWHRLALLRKKPG